MLRFVTVLALSLTLAVSPASAGSSKQQLAESILDAGGSEAEFESGFRSTFGPGFVMGLGASGQLRVPPGREKEVEALALEWWMPKLQPLVDRLYVELRARTAATIVERLRGSDLKKWAAFEASHPTPELRAVFASSDVGQRVAVVQGSLGVDMAGIAAVLMSEHQGEFGAVVGVHGAEFAAILMDRGLLELVP